MLRVIQVGVRGMGQVWTECVAREKSWEAAAYVDTSESNLVAAADRHGMPKSRCYTDLKRALAEVEADALIDVTPQKFRRQVCEAALDRGLHVLSEKPLADTLANARAIIAKARAVKRTYMVAQNYRYQPEVLTIRKFLRQDRLGTPGYVSARFFKGPHFGGYREQMAYPLVLDMSIHHIDMARSFLDTDVKAVQAVSISAPWSWYKGDATVMATLEMANGVMVNYCASWVSQAAETSWNGHWRFDGGKGVLLWEEDALTYASKPGTVRPVAPVKMKTTGQACLLESFRKAIETGEEPETSGRLNLNSLAATFAVVLAAKEKRRVLVRDLLK